MVLIILIMNRYQSDKIFLFVDDNLPADKHLWLRRKANVAKHFEESSLSVNIGFETSFLKNFKFWSILFL